VIYIIIDKRRQTLVLKKLADTLLAHKEYALCLRMIQQRWLKTETRDEAIWLLPLAFSFIPPNPELGIAFANAFTWVEDFLGR